VTGETERINLPGSVQDANWAYRLEVPVQELLQRAETREAADRLRELSRAARRIPEA